MQTNEQANRPKGHPRLEYGKPYSNSLDYAIGATSLNSVVRMSEDEQHPTKFSRELRGETGLIFKEPLY